MQAGTMEANREIITVRAYQNAVRGPNPAPKFDLCLCGQIRATHANPDLPGCDGFIPASPFVPSSD